MFRSSCYLAAEDLVAERGVGKYGRDQEHNAGQQEELTIRQRGGVPLPDVRRHHIRPECLTSRLSADPSDPWQHALPSFSAALAATDSWIPPYSLSGNSGGDAPTKIKGQIERSKVGLTQGWDD